MFKCYLILVSIFWVISSSAQGANLSVEERNDLETLQTCALKLKDIAVGVNKKLQKEHHTSPTEWITPPNKDALEKFVELCSAPIRAWPEYFPISKDQPKVANMLQYNTQFRQIYKIEFFRKGSVTCFYALNKRRSTGKGLTFKDLEHHSYCQNEFDVLGQTMESLLPLVDTCNNIFQLYASKFSTICFLIMQTVETGALNPRLGSTPFQDQFNHALKSLESSGKVIVPSLKTTTASVQDEFIKAKLFLDVILSVYGPTLNAWGNLLKIYALIYKELGDGSLVDMLPEITLNQ